MSAAMSSCVTPGHWHTSNRDCIGRRVVLFGGRAIPLHRFGSTLGNVLPALYRNPVLFGPSLVSRLPKLGSQLGRRVGYGPC
jgi:hypothetical protein